MFHKYLLLAVLVTAGFVACESPEHRGQFDAAINAQKIRAHLKFLSDDLMEGRAPGSRGSKLAAAYIASQFQEAGLLPAVGDSSYFQNVELFGIKSTPGMSVRGYDQVWRLTPGNDFVAWNQSEQPVFFLRNKEIVFMGYGIEAPEFNWSDYQNYDVTGKVLLLLVNEPRSQSTHFFDGKALTYYGRWTYKFEEAARRGADGVILIHTTSLAGYGWNVVRNSRTKELLYIKQPEDIPLLRLQAWITEEKAAELLDAAGLNLTTLIEEAGASSFQPIELNLRVSATIRNQTRILNSPNVIAKIMGSDSVLSQECVVYTSHYDHLGTREINEANADDNIFNGAFDNASGTAALLEIARGWAQSPIRPKRTLLFAAVTAEESGLLGSQYYTEHPVFPLAKTSANINLDAVNVWGKTADIVALGAERSGIYQVVQNVANDMNMKLALDPLPGKGIFFRSDQFSFIKKGVPAVFLKAGTNYINKPKGWGLELMRKYTRDHYHRVRDEYDQEWSLDGSAQVAQFALKTGYYLANAAEMPVWLEGQPYRRGRRN